MHAHSLKLRSIFLMACIFWRAKFQNFFGSTKDIRDLKWSGSVKCAATWCWATPHDTSCLLLLSPSNCCLISDQYWMRVKMMSPQAEAFNSWNDQANILVLWADPNPQHGRGNLFRQHMTLSFSNYSSCCFWVEHTMMGYKRSNSNPSPMRLPAAPWCSSCCKWMYKNIAYKFQP